MPEDLAQFLPAAVTEGMERIDVRRERRVPQIFNRYRSVPVALRYQGCKLLRGFNYGRGSI
jgi:hypothetical protein